MPNHTPSLVHTIRLHLRGFSSSDQLLQERCCELSRRGKQSNNNSTSWVLGFGWGFFSFYAHMVCLCKHVIIHLRYKISSKRKFQVLDFYVQTKHTNHMMKQKEEQISVSSYHLWMKHQDAYMILITQDSTDCISRITYGIHDYYTLMLKLDCAQYWGLGGHVRFPFPCKTGVPAPAGGLD